MPDHTTNLTFTSTSFTCTVDIKQRRLSRFLTVAVVLHALGLSSPRDFEAVGIVPTSFPGSLGWAIQDGGDSAESSRARQCFGEGGPARRIGKSSPCEILLKTGVAG